MRPPPSPKDDIGPAWKLIGTSLMVAGVGFIGLDVKAHGMSWIDLGFFAVVAMFFLSLHRPKKFDLVVKTIADKLPGFKFDKGGK